MTREAGESRINEERFWSRITEMGRIGANKAGGIDRAAYSPAYLEACARFASWASDAGASVKVDAVGNVIAAFMSECGADDEQAVVIGSHLDTVPNGGRFDGALGVLAGLEAVQTLHERGFPFARPVLLVAFADEEGAHGAGTVGSRAMCFGLDEAALAVRKDPSSPSLAESMMKAGFNPTAASDARRNVQRWDSFVEVHPEQGAILERRSLDLAVVTAIVHSARLRVRIEGDPNHAGTTPMVDRDDALLSAARLIQEIHDYALAIGTSMVATVGRIVVEPNAINVIPGLVDFSVDIRAPAGTQVDDAISWLQSSVDGIGGTCELLIRKQGADMDASVQAGLAAAVAKTTSKWTYLPSGAGHDARTIAHAGVPTGMLFVPSHGGISHSPLEASSRGQCAIAVQALTTFVAERTAPNRSSIDPA